MSIDFFLSLSSSEPSLLPPEFNSPNKPPALKVLSQTQLQGKPKLSANPFLLAEDSLVILLNLNLGTYQVGAIGKKKKKKLTCRCRRCKRLGFDPRVGKMATHSNILAWKIPWTEKLDGLQSTRSQELDMT